MDTLAAGEHRSWCRAVRQPVDRAGCDRLAAETTRVLAEELPTAPDALSHITFSEDPSRDLRLDGPGITRAQLVTRRATVRSRAASV
ncbi:hypothetical protein [Streptomyces niger]|uniref:hypothetical protein n=1 Tax=Streptomyces niger TaxID=66373 RepID=UPI0018FE5BA4|nr:hypothetical protein [Streptomyces niger]